MFDVFYLEDLILAIKNWQDVTRAHIVKVSYRRPDLLRNGTVEASITPEHFIGIGGFADLATYLEFYPSPKCITNLGISPVDIGTIGPYFTTLFRKIFLEFAPPFRILFYY